MAEVGEEEEEEVAEAGARPLQSFTSDSSSPDPFRSAWTFSDASHSLSQSGHSVLDAFGPAASPNPKAMTALDGIVPDGELGWSVGDQSWSAAARAPPEPMPVERTPDKEAEAAASAARMQERLERARTHTRARLTAEVAAAPVVQPLENNSATCTKCACAFRSEEAAAPSPSGGCMNDESFGVPNQDSHASSRHAGDPLSQPAERLNNGGIALETCTGSYGPQRTSSSLAKPPAPSKRRSDFDATAVSPSRCAAASTSGTSVAPTPSSASGALQAVHVPDAGAYEDGFGESPGSPDTVNEGKPMLGSSSNPPHPFGGLRRGVGALGSRGKAMVVGKSGEQSALHDAATTGLLVGSRNSISCELDAVALPTENERALASCFSSSPHEVPPGCLRDPVSPATRLCKSPVMVRWACQRTGPSSPSERSHSSLQRRRSPSECSSSRGSIPDDVPFRRRKDSFSDPDREPPISPRHSIAPCMSIPNRDSGDSECVNGVRGQNVSEQCSQLPSCSNPTEASAAPNDSADCFAPPVASYEQELLVAVRKFNVKPRHGVAYLQDRGFLRDDPASTARFLRSTKGLSKRMLGDYLGERGDPNEKVLAEYVRLFNFAGLSFVAAIRAFLTPFRLPGEAQKIDRIMCEFASHFTDQNPDVFSSADTAYVLGFSVIMLNTDAHSVQIKAKNKMTKAEFVRNNRGIDSGKDLPTELLESVYDDIQNDEIRTGMSHDDMGELELLEFFKQGSAFKKYNHARLAADRAHPCRLWIAADELRYQNLAARGKREKSIPLSLVEGVLVGPASEVFRRNGISAKSPEALGCFSLVCGGRTLDLQAATHEELEIWTHFFQQVVERSRLEQHARRVALRGQPREAFLLSASDIWWREILPNWDIARLQPRTRMLWWEGVPTGVRTQLWRLAIGDATVGSSHGYEWARAETRPVDRLAALERITREICEPMRAFPSTPPTAGVPVDFNLFTADDSPMHASLLNLLAALEASARNGGPKLGENSSLLAAALLLYLEQPAAFGCMCSLLDSHFIGRLREEGGAESTHALWRMRAARSAMRRELPTLTAHLSTLAVELDDFLPVWLSSLFLSTLALDTAARVWDCYLRDGEALVWQVALELLRILSPILLKQDTREGALSILHHASAAGGATEKALFSALAAGDATLHEMLRCDFSQKLPMPAPDRGVVFDLWCNSFEADSDATASVRHGSLGGGGLRMADGTVATRLISEDATRASYNATDEPGRSFDNESCKMGSDLKESSLSTPSLMRPIENWLRSKWEYRGTAR